MWMWTTSQRGQNKLFWYEDVNKFWRSKGLEHLKVQAPFKGSVDTTSKDFVFKKDHAKWYQKASKPSSKLLLFILSHPSLRRKTHWNFQIISPLPLDFYCEPLKWHKKLKLSTDYNDNTKTTFDKAFFPWQTFEKRNEMKIASQQCSLTSATNDNKNS